MTINNTNGNKPLWMMGWSKNEIEAILKRRRAARAIIDSREYAEDRNLPSPDYVDVEEKGLEGGRETDSPLLDTLSLPEKVALECGERLATKPTKRTFVEWLTASLLSAQCSVHEPDNSPNSVDVEVEGVRFRLTVTIPRRN